MLSRSAQPWGRGQQNPGGPGRPVLVGGFSPSHLKNMRKWNWSHILQRFGVKTKNVWVATKQIKYIVFWKLDHDFSSDLFHQQFFWGLFLLNDPRDFQKKTYQPTATT